MARGEKKEKLSLEEKLAQALVPAEEQPYEVPENWCWTRLDKVSEIIMGQSPAGTDTTDDSNYMPLIGGAADMGALYPIISRYTKVSTKVTEKDDLIICIRATLGKPVYSDGEYCLGRGVAGIRARCCRKEYVMYFFKAHEQYLYENATGTTFAQVTGKVLAQMPFPLSPLSEQQRIVERIESLFAKLDEVKEKVQEVIISCEIRQAAILRDVFNGKLSESWRIKNGIDGDSWNNIFFDDCIDKMQNGLAKRSGQEGDLVGVLRLANLEEKNFNIDDLREIRLTNKERDTYKLNVNDIVMIRVNGSRDNVGKQILVKEECDWAFCDHIIRIVVRKNIEPAFMVMFSETDEYRHYIEENMVSSAGQNTISRKGLSELCIPVPTIDEQIYLIQTVNEMTQKDIIIKENAKGVQEKIDLMKKSILAKAFRGELGTNNPQEESAIELLKTILEKA